MMQGPADSVRAFINVTFPKEALPWPVILTFMVCISIVVGMLIQKAKWYKSYAQDFPTQSSTVVAGIGGFLITLALTLTRGALGMSAFDGMDWAFSTSAAMAGVGGGVLIGKRFSSLEYMESKAKVEAAKAGAAPPQVNVSGDATVNATATGEQVSVPAPVVPAKGPSFGGKSR